jgi:hypothetical protein
LEKLKAKNFPNLVLKKIYKAWTQCLIPVNPAMQEITGRKIMVPG